MMTLDAIVESLGGMGRFQVLFVLLCVGPKMLYGWSMLHMSFAGVTPDWFCVTSGSNATTAIADNSSFQQCDVNGSECPRAVFHSSMSTVISEWSLVCDRAVIRPTIISIQMAGVLVGAFITGQIADLVGRRHTFFAGMALHGALNIVAAYSVSWQMFAALRFFIGMGIGSFLVLAIPYCMEFQPTKFRSLVSAIPWWSMGVALLVFTAWLVEDWSRLHLINGLLHIPAVLGFFVLPESMRWLAVRRRLDEAEAVLDKMAAVNRKTKPPSCRVILEAIADEEKASQAQSQKHSYLDIYRGWKIAKASLLTQYIWISLSVSYYGISFGVVGLSGNVYINMLIINTMDSPLALATFWLSNRFGRRRSAASFFLIGALAGLGNIAVVLAAPEDKQATPIKILCLMAQFGVGSAWVTMMTLTNETYPTSIRNLGYGAANTTSRIGGIIAPYVIDFAAQPIASYVVIGCTLGLSTIAVLLLDETNHQKLPDTLVSSGLGDGSKIKGNDGKEGKEKSKKGEIENGIATTENGGMEEVVYTKGEQDFYSTYL